MVYSKNGCTRKPALDGKLRKSILIVFSLQPLCLRMQQMKPYPRKHTHTHTHKHSHLSFSSAHTLPSLSPLVLPHPDQYHRSASYQAAKWPHHHKHTHTHTLPLHLTRERVDGYNKDWLARAASSRCAKSSAAAAALWSVRRLYWFSYGRFICCWTVLNAHFLLSCYTLIKGRLEAGRWGGPWREWRRDEIKTRG